MESVVAVVVKGIDLPGEAHVDEVTAIAGEEVRKTPVELGARVVLAEKVEMAIFDATVTVVSVFVTLASEMAGDGLALS